MILQPSTRNEFDLVGNILVDVENKGFTQEEMQKLAGPESGEPGGKGWKGLPFFGRNREVPSEIQNLKSEFGYQSQPFLTDLIAVAEAQQTPLEGIIKARSDRYNFYIMRCGVYIAPQDGERFEALKFEVRYKNDSASTYGMLPGPEAKRIFELGGKADIGVNGKVEFGFPEKSLAAAAVDASAKAELESKFIVSFHYELKAQVVDAFGVGNPFTKWLMHKGDDLRNDVVFYPIIMTPKSVTGFECEFKAFFKIGHADWKHSEFFLKPPKSITVSA